jgi:hypothetical protein
MNMWSELWTGEYEGNKAWAMKPRKVPEYNLQWCFSKNTLEERQVRTVVSLEHQLLDKPFMIVVIK